MDTRLKKYFQSGNVSNSGCLLAEKLGFTFTPTNNKGKSPNYIMTTPDGDFYAKVVTKKSADAELMVGAFMDKAGLNCATYYPVQDGQGRLIVASNNIVTSESVSPKDFNSELAVYTNYGNGLLFWAQKQPWHYGFSKHFTAEAMKEIISTDVIQMITGNLDGSDNFFYCVNNGIATGLQLFDNGETMIEDGNLNYLSLGYTNHFSTTAMDYQHMLMHLKHNESVLEVTSPKELCNMVGCFKPLEVASQLKHEFGYEVDSLYASALDESCNRFCENIMLP